MRLVDPKGETFVEVCIQEGTCFFTDDKNLKKLAEESPSVTLEDGKIFSRIDGKKTQIGTFKSIFEPDSTMANVGFAALAISQADSPAPGPADVVAVGVFATGLTLMGANKHNQKVIDGLLRHAEAHLNKLLTSPPNDPIAKQGARQGA
jgi:hypothetical protein